MKICVIGNSHAAALKTASDAANASEASQLDFYAIMGREQPLLRLEGGRLHRVSVKKDTLTTVADAASLGLEIASYDALVISACGWFAARSQYIATDPRSHPLGHYRCADWAAARGDGPWRNTEFVSAAVFDAIVEAYVREHASIQLAQLLSEHFRGFVWLQPWPAPGRVLRSDPAWFVNAWYGPQGPAAWFRFFIAQRLALETVTKELGPRFIFLDYPLPGPTFDGFMNAEWCDSRDPWHANERYGRLVLDQLEAVSGDLRHDAATA